ncbi:TPA: hypothetical protein NGU23_004228 [Vibrio parahaemolyticus]|uniref:DNA-binding transcriptional repressor CapW winged helix-turn-helix domain-containing protein n=1 Tax=Vibrio parahaemolyticus TaxID=670 RepID=A0AAW3IRE4_VIBPH|nr:hypothetical protein [Vibrio parahaemolyticus]KOY18538.1 hypothetical protein ACX12_23420 [Vibrio parahaemolyticus]KOY26449.1 hypothetical protein ACX05_20090 [Vibrio parahaemolyticus]MCC3858920.1 hypothetical protein [Vibrio parahaemolyticus]MCF9466167.1 hypothetical protein [Vibrio parahaemolyticus]MCF9530369.1 hypothetical protein [Vibrio parahaemolyticus]
MSRPLLDDAVFKFIDAKLLIHGCITTVDVSKAFGLGRQKVSGLFTKYRNAHPHNMHHDVHQKCYVRDDTFDAGYLTNISPNAYLDAVYVVFGKPIE